MVMAYSNPERVYERTNETISTNVSHSAIPTEAREREEFLKQYCPGSVKGFVESLRTYYPNEFNEILSSWVNIHKVSIDYSVSSEELLALLPHLKYVELTEVSLDVLKQISTSENIEEFLCSTYKLDGNALKYFAPLKNLRSFTACFKYVDSDAIEAFGENASGLEKLDVFYNEERRTYLNLTGFGKLTNLTSLAIRGFERIGDAGLAFMQNLRHLKELRLENPNNYSITLGCASNLKKLEFLSISPDPIARTRNIGLPYTYLDSRGGLCSKQDSTIQTDLSQLNALKNVTTLKHLNFYSESRLYVSDLDYGLPGVKISYGRYI